MPLPLRFPDDHSRDDVLTFAGRVAHLAESAVRLQAAGGVLALTAAPLAPRGLMDATPTVLAMRTSHVDPELECDLIVEAGLLAPGPGEQTIALPESAVRAGWAGISAPRSGWAPATALAAADLAVRAREGMARVAQSLPADAGDDVVHRVRAQVWGERLDEWGGLPLGIAFAAVTLGFISGAEDVSVFVAASWTRITFARGHLLVRGPVAMGLTPVRSTGAGSRPPA